MIFSGVEGRDRDRDREVIRKEGAGVGVNDHPSVSFSSRKRHDLRCSFVFNSLLNQHCAPTGTGLVGINNEPDG